MPILTFPPKLHALLNADASGAIRGYRQFVGLAIGPPGDVRSEPDQIESPERSACRASLADPRSRDRTRRCSGTEATSSEKSRLNGFGTAQRTCKSRLARESRFAAGPGPENAVPSPILHARAPRPTSSCGGTPGRASCPQEESHVGYNTTGDLNVDRAPTHPCGSTPPHDG